MKIRIITCHDVANYGASLQALASQTFLKSLGHDVLLIDYIPQYSRPYQYWDVSPKSHLYQPSRYFFLVKCFWALRTYLRRYPTLKRLEAFSRFRNQYLCLTRPYHTYEELASDPPEADIYIAGSDQIWRTNLQNGKDPAFYLQFGSKDTKRISLSASFGNPFITDGLQFLLTTYLSMFDSISVRESSGLRILNELGIEGRVTLDPVFLLSRQEWLDLFHIRDRKITEDYLLVYDLNRLYMHQEKMAFVRSYASKYHLKIVAINDSRVTPYADINVNDGGPEDFVNLIAHASMVVSDSFHATAFSTIMQTPFRVFFDRPQAARIKDFLELIHASQCLNNDHLDVTVDWSAVNAVLEYQINELKSFLIHHIS